MDITQIITAAVTSRIDALVKEITDDLIGVIGSEQTASCIGSDSSPLELLLKGDPITASLHLKAKGIDFEKISDILIVEPKDCNVSKLQADLSAVLRDEKRLYLTDVLDGRLVILTTFTCSNMDLEEEIRFYLDSLDSVSTVFFYTDCTDIDEMRKNYNDYCQNAAALHKIYPARRILNIHDINLSKEILSLARSDKKKKAHILSIIDALKDDHDNLMETLAIYLIDCDAQLNKAASTLYLHRNTVSYRLNKIKQLSGADFSRMPASYDYYSAAALWRLTAS